MLFPVWALPQALFARVGGGYIPNDAGPISGKVEAGIPEDDREIRLCR